MSLSRCPPYGVKVKSGFDPGNGTVVRRTGARCLISDSPIPFDHARDAGKNGEMKARLLAIVCKGARERVYLSPEKKHIETAGCGLPEQYPISDIPEQALGFSVQLYGMNEHWKLFTPRQLTSLTMFSDLISETRDQVLRDATAVETLPDNKYLLNEGDTGPNAYADAVVTYLTFAINKCVDYWNTVATWMPRGTVGHALNKQAIPMTWDYPEANPFADFHCAWHEAFEWVSKTIDNMPENVLSGSSRQLDVLMASKTTKQAVVSTDPPYYDNIGYADLSDFFYIWLRRSLKDVYPDLLSTMLTPKAEEMIASPYRHDSNRAKAAAFFENRLGRAIEQWRMHGNCDYPTTVFYAFKQAETDTSGTASTGWETFLSGVISQGYTITATWPLRTERSARSVAIGTNALGSSVVLACIPRAANAPMATRRELLNELKRELPDALRLLQSGYIAPVDLAQAAIGPGMAVFSRYAKVIEADGSQMTVRTALTMINQMPDEVLAEQEGEFDADTRWAVAWFEQYGIQEGPFGIAETLSKAKNTSVQGLAEAGIVKSRSGSVQLLDRSDMSNNWDPTADKRLTAWEATQYLIRTLDQEGESGAADILRKLGGSYGDKSRDLAYRLYSICERKGWASEALAYNSIVLAWPEISKMALSTPKAGQQNLFE